MKPANTVPLSHSNLDDLTACKGSSGERLEASGDLPFTLDVDVRNHIDETLQYLPENLHSSVLKEYTVVYRERTPRDANLFILELRLNYKIVRLIPSYFLPAFLRVFADFFKKGGATKKLDKKMQMVAGIRGFWAIAYSGEAAKILAKEMAERCRRMLEVNGLDYVLTFVIDRGIFSVAGESEAQELRLSSPRWWRGQLRTIRDQGCEALAQLLGMVGKYVSNYSQKIQQKRHESNILMLADNVAVSPDGKEVCLLDIAMSAIRGRFSRLLNWADGMGNYAEKHGHKCAMFTITCPSKMHAYSSKYDGTTVRESQQYLADLWNQANARFKKRGLYPYGFRVAEPHKRDGAVHWHILIFAPVDVLEEIDVILSDHALREDGFELGADAHRYEFKLIDKESGGAKPSSYLFKYLMKGLGGKENYTADDVHKIVEDKLTGVKAWAKTHGIRQVQMVGGASVGVWNELRRVGDAVEDEQLEKMRAACHEGDFCTFFELQGGHKKGKTKHYAKVWRQRVAERFNEDTGELIIACNDYKEEISEAVGLESTKDLASADYWCVFNKKPKWSIDWKTSEKQGSGIEGLHAWEVEPVSQDGRAFGCVDPDVLTLGV